MKSLQAFGAALNVEHGEERLIRLLFSHAFFGGMTKAFVRTSAYTLFLSEFEIKLLPLVYVGSAFAGTLVTLLYLRLDRRLSLSKLLSANLCFTAVSLFGFAFAVLITDAKWIVFALPILSEVIISLINTESATLNSHVLTVRQGKRLLGVIGSGEFLAEIGVGFSIVVLVALIGTSNLLFLGALSSVAALAVLARIFAGATYRLSTSPKSDEGAATTKGNISFFAMVKNRYIFLLFFSYVFFILTYYFVDSVFYYEVSSRFSSDEEIATFLGRFSALYGFLALLSLVFLSGKVLKHYGLLVGLMILPIGMVLGILSVMVTGAFDGLETLIFWFAVMTQLTRFVLNNAFNRPSRNILSQALPAEQRSWTLATMFGIVDPISTGIAGVCLWVFMNVLAFGTVQLFYVVSIVLVLWAFLLVLTYREYLVSLASALSKRQLTGTSLDLHDRSTISVVKQGLNSAYPAEVIYCLNVLEDMRYDALEPTLVGLLNHSHPEVRREALRKLRKLDSTTAVRLVRGYVETEASPEVLGEAIRTLAHLGETDSIEEIAPYLDHPDSRVKLGAMVGLLRNGGIEGVLVAGSSFLDLSKSKDPNDRAFAAQVCGEIGIASFYRPLLALLQDDNLDVRKMALVASKNLRATKLVPLVAEHLGTPSLRVSATSSLIAMGDDALPTLEALLNDERQSRDTQARVAYVLGRIGGEKAIAILKSKIDHTDKELRSSILNALTTCRYQADGDEAQIVGELLKNEVLDATWVCAGSVSLGKDEPTSLLTRALELELTRARERIVLLLSFLYSPQTVLRCKIYLSDKSAEKRAYALEVIDNLVPMRTREMVFPLLEDLTIEERRNRLAAQNPVKDRSKDEWIRQMAAEASGRLLPWTRCCALYAMGCSPRPAYEGIAVAALSSSIPLVRETAVWTLGKLNPSDLLHQLEALLEDAVPQVSAMARSVLSQAS